MFQAPAPAENTAEFQRITQIPRSLPTQSANYAKFAHFVKHILLMFQISDHRQRTKENWSESTRFRSIRPPITRITRIPHISQ